MSEFPALVKSYGLVRTSVDYFFISSMRYMFQTFVIYSICLKHIQVSGETFTNVESQICFAHLSVTVQIFGGLLQS